MILVQQASRIFNLRIVRHNNNNNNRSSDSRSSNNSRTRKRSNPNSVLRRPPFHTPMEHQQRRQGNIPPEDEKNSAYCRLFNYSFSFVRKNDNGQNVGSHIVSSFSICFVAFSFLFILSTFSDMPFQRPGSGKWPKVEHLSMSILSCVVVHGGLVTCLHCFPIQTEHPLSLRDHVGRFACLLRVRFYLFSSCLSRPAQLSAPPPPFFCS
jgi:hypothetical protein